MVKLDRNLTELNTENIISVSAKDVTKRLDLFLAENTAFTRANIQKSIKAQQILVNNSPSKASYCLKEADKITILPIKPVIVDILPENIPLDIVYQDTYLAVINKAKGMVVHPAVGNYEHTMVNALLYHCQDLSGINGELRPGILHRLDKDTSGLIVIAKNDFAHVNLARQIETKQATRVYLALVFGNIKQDKGEINLPIGRDEKDRKRMAVAYKNSKAALTTYQVLERFGDYTLISCKLHTGRTHQIRVHLSHLGFPLVGDEKYTTRKNKFGVVGQMLHSALLKLTHPQTNREMVFTAKLPNSFLRVLKILRIKKKNR